MKWSTLKYLFKEGIVGLWKNRIMALASAGTIILCLLILGVSYALGTNIDYVLKQLETKFGITAYVKADTDENRILEIRSQISSLPHIVQLEYISKEDALKLFSEESEDDALFENFKKDNPLPASFEITVDNVVFQEEVVAEMSKISELEIVYLEKETDMFIKINNTVNYISLGMSACLIIVGLLLMANTIKLTVYIRRKEINIMKYIGATDWFIRLPFLIEGLLIGTIAAVMSIMGIVMMYNGFTEFITTHLAGMLSGFIVKPSSEIMTILIPVYLAIGIGIGLVGSGTAIHKHLKV